MVYQYIERTAIPAWGPQHAQPLIAAGTVAGAMDATFSNTSTLEIFQLTGDKDNESTSGLEAIGKVEANARFQRLAWSTSSSSDSLGVLAGGLENGDITAWNANSILSGDEPLVLHTSAAHTGAVGGLAFNPSAPNLLASGSSNGEVFVWDIVSDFKSYSPGPRSQRLDTVTDLSWNNQVHHILATASSSGALVVWDLRARRDVITLGNVGAIGQQTRPGISATEWNPLSATQLVTASADDTNPVISLWDLRNAQAPSQTLGGGHQRGILSLSWCRKDAGLLLSSGKDNRTVCWNPNDGSIVGELPPSSNWVYDVQWNQANPNLLSAASFDGRVSLYELSRQGPDTPAEDPFAPQSSSPFAPSLSLKKPPKWLARPCGAAFGFGGQLVHFGQGGGSLVNITEFVAEPELAAQAQQLEDMLDGNQAAELCKERAGGEDEKSWQVLQILFEEDARDKLVKFLGFDKDQVKTRIQDIVEKEKEEEEVKEETKEEEESDNPFESSTADADDDFFSKQQPQPSQVDDLQVAFSGAFSLYDKAKDIGAEDADGLITRAILLGDIEAAVTLCIEQERFADALILAPYGSPELAQRVQKQYFAKRAQQAPYVRLLHAIATNDLSDVVANADLAEWDEVLALLCTYAQGDQFSTLCDALGQRLQQVGDSNAVLCYLASGSLDRVAGIWIAEKKDVRSLHVLVEKVAVFRNAVQFVDSGEPPFVLAPLYDCYVEYAEFLAAQGLFAIAAKYLDRVPADYRQGAKDSAAVLRYRLALTSVAPWTTVQVGPVAPAQPAHQQQQPSQSFVQQQQQQPYVQQQPFAQQQQQQPPAQQQQAYGGYPQAYPSTMPAVQQYAAQPAQAYPGYSNVGYQQPSGVFQPPPPQPLNPATIPTGLTPPPQRREDVPWNDPPPMLAKPSKRPSQAAAAKPIVSPFPHGRDTPPPPQQQPSAAAAAGPPRGGFVPNAGKPLPPPPPPAGQPMQQQQPMQQHQPMQPGFVPQPMQQPGFVPQPMQQPGFVPQPAMPMHQQQQQQAPPQSMRGQVVSAASAAPPAAAARSPPSAPSPKPTGPKYPAGDRTHLPEVWKPAVGALSAHLARAKQFGAPAQKRIVEDAERRLNALFDLMNCDEVKMKERLAPLFEQLVQAIGARHFPAALNVQAEIMTVNADLTSSVVGVKHLVNVLKTLPM
ncbi:protein transport protein S31 [Coemansia furcata]|nr:protein transport protein S31 [Coemansia furcata]